MLSIPEDVTLVWDSTNATIPSGWSRETDFDGLYPKAWGSSVDPDTTGGASTHTHTSPAHTHTISSHTHTFTISTVSGATSKIRCRNIPDTIFNGDHYHTASIGAVNGGTVSNTLTYGSVSNDPENYSVIFIKAQAGAILQDNICGLWGGYEGVTTIPSNWSEVTAARNRFLKGALTEADAGGTGGSTTNVHDISHSHTSVNHAHDSVSSTVQNAYAGGQGGGIANNVLANHYHTISFSNTSIAPQSYSGSLTTTETVEPAYTKLTLIKRGTNGLKVKGLVGLWKKSVALIPQGWVVMDGNNGTVDLRDKFIKIGSSISEIELTGGSNTHVHASQNHTHTGTSHTHTASVSVHVAGNNDNSAGDPYEGMALSTIGQHSATGFSTDIANWNAGSTTANSSSNEPEYRTAVYIQFQKEVGSGGLLMQMMG